MAVTRAYDGGRVAWVVPTYRHGRPLWRMSEAAVGPLKTLGVVVNRAERTIEFPSGGFLGVYSMDSPDSIRGEAFHLVIIDEAAMIAEEAWTDAIQPTLADFGGNAILISTPKGHNWFHREFIRGLSGEDGCLSFTAPSSDNPNPNIQAASLRARDQVPERTYRQEWLAEFVEHQGQVFRNLAECLTLSEALPLNHRGHQVSAGLDWGQTEDFTVISVLCADCQAELHLDRFRRLPWAQQRDRLAALISRWHVVDLLAEQNAIGSPNIEALSDAGFPVRAFTTTAASKPPLIQNLALAFERAEVRWLKADWARAELEAFACTINPVTGRQTYAAPEGVHDDSVIARALALRASQTYISEIAI